jgi:hypothetical protein
MVTGSAGFCWFTRSTDSCRSRELTVASSGATNWARIVALDTALSAANVRISKASGSMNDTTISEPIASTSQMTRRLIGGFSGIS